MVAVTRLRRQRAGQTILRFFKRGVHRLVNDQDPITMDRWERPVFFRIASSGIPGQKGLVYAFSAKVLVHYLDSANDFRCPLTRDALTTPELRRLERIARVPEIDLVSTLEARRQERARRQQQESILGFLESQALSQVELALDVQQDLNCSDRDCVERLVNDPGYVLEFVRYLNTLIGLDVERALDCGVAAVERVKGAVRDEVQGTVVYRSTALCRSFAKLIVDIVATMREKRGPLTGGMGLELQM